VTIPSRVDSPCADVGAALAAEFGKEEWDALRHAVKTKHGAADVADIYKCSAFIQQLLSELWDGDKRCSTLDQLCKAVVAFAKVQTGPAETAMAGETGSEGGSQ